MRGILWGALLGGAVMFIWGFLFWTVLPFGSNAVKGTDNQAQVQRELAKILPDTGVYVVPYADDPSDTAYQALHKQGPIATIYFRRDGSEPMATSTFVMGYLHGALVLLVMGLALKLADVTSFGARLMLIVLTGAAGSLYAHFSGPIWWLQPWGYSTSYVIYEIISWLVGGAVLAGSIKPSRAMLD